MCGRYNITDSPLVHALLEELGIDIGPLPTRYNIAPTENVPVIFAEEGNVQLTEMRWWLTPSWVKEITSQYSMFNARSENLKKNPAFRGPYRHKRAVMPASSFIEWQRSGNEKSPMCIRKEDEALAFACGIIGKALRELCGPAPLSPNRHRNLFLRCIIEYR